MKKTVKSEYFYNEKGNIDHSVATETTEEYVCDKCDECEDGELLTSEVEVTSETDRALVITLTLAAIGLCISAVSSIIRQQ